MSTLYTYPYICAFAFLLLNIGIGLVLLWIVQKPARPFFKSGAEVVAPFGNLLALLFGLFAAFLANDVSVHVERAHKAVNREANAMAVVVDVAGALAGGGKTLERAAVEFGQRTTRADWSSRQQTAAADALSLAMLHEVLFGGLATADSQVRQTAAATIMELRAARNEMIAVARSHTSAQKWIAFALGILTQFGIVIVHFGRPRAAALAVTLFAIGMAFMLWVVLMRLDPFGGENAVPLTPIGAAYAGVDVR